ncbi:pyruvoyl-dependent arginine decarboxylase [Candidatus Nomurabacteria bacterium]|nr:pyruvoyl-dependent arginine decarboxylase [Candidatus Saccharibacteria bacterium]MCB9821991.1 pyruvoyl-dependent arginine decarboxylase [Candidatus Nomurabacteria bacterium]
MRIPITTATGIGETNLAAFDNALTNAGIENRNLIRLSSVVPPNTEIDIVEAPFEDTPGGWGDRLYVVYADQRASKVGEEAWAGIGWVQDPTDNKGLFVEHEGPSEHSVTSDIKFSLNGLLKNRNIEGSDWRRGQEVVGIECTESGLAVCALAVAMYQASDWNNVPYLLR